MTAPDFGLESLIRLQPIDSEKNALILLVHFALTRNGWLYMGRGTEWFKDEVGTETLPQDWAASDLQYRYVSRTEKPRKYVLNFFTHDVFLLVNLVSVEDQVAMSMNIDTTTEVDSTKFSTNNPRLIFPKLLNLLNRIHDQLVQPCQTSHRTVGTSTGAPSNPHRDERDPPRTRPLGEPYVNPLWRNDPLRGEVPLGRRDLDPFLGPGPGGGNIIDPLRDLRNPRFPGQPPLGPDGVPLPPGAVPPGARFDPFLPEGAIRPDVGRNPDLDEAQPFPGRPRAPRGSGPFGGGPFAGGPFGGGGFGGGGFGGGGFI